MKINWGGIAFIIGLIVAVFVAFFGATSRLATLVLVALGLLVGILNVTGKESIKFLVATIAFIVTFNALGGVFNSIPLIGALLSQLVVFVGSAAAIVAVTSLISITRD